MVRKINFDLFKRRIQINMSNKSFYSLIVFGVLILVCIGVYAYGSSNPSVMGHSWGEVECSDCISASNIAANAVGNSELIDNPSFSSVTLGGVSRSSWPSGAKLEIYTTSISAGQKCSNSCTGGFTKCLYSDPNGGYILPCDWIANQPTRCLCLR